MTSNIHATWAYGWSDNPLKNTFMGSVPAGVDLVAMFNNMSEYSSLASSSYQEVIGWNEPYAPAAPVDSATAARDWRGIVKTVGKRMGSLASAHTSLTEGDWFYDFMTTARLHLPCTTTPPDRDVSEFQSYIEGVYNIYKLPS